MLNVIYWLILILKKKIFTELLIINNLKIIFNHKQYINIFL